MEKLPLRPNVCMLVYNCDHKLFLGERFGEPGVWQFPQGGVDLKVALEESVYRELWEEIGIGRDKLSIIKRCDATHSYEFQDPPGYARGKWRGQSQTFWIVRFEGTDKDISLTQHEQEFMSWRWCSPAEVRVLAEPKRRPGYEAPLKEFEALKNL
ncbi:MAG: NUDIX domain-containing protein [Oligoflexia bacterium]|nr:NUDIX domain-containing protein [Oligoflexia bacterium]